MGEWNKQKAKGNIAEDIVEMIINSMPDWKCIKFGVENHIEELRKNVRETITPITLQIKSMPDFIAVNEKTKEVLFIEVKYRSFVERTSEKAIYGFGYKQIDDYLEFWKNAKIIFVNKQEPYFKVVDLKEVNKEKQFVERTMNEGAHYEQWNFINIEKDIKVLFPEIEDKVLEEAIELIP
jgi:hypothetical protein